jgi:hypothetical protein
MHSLSLSSRFLLHALDITIPRPLSWHVLTDPPLLPTRLLQKLWMLLLVLAPLLVQFIGK